MRIWEEEGGKTKRNKTKHTFQFIPDNKWTYQTTTTQKAKRIIFQKKNQVKHSSINIRGTLRSEGIKQKTNKTAI